MQIYIAIKRINIAINHVDYRASCSSKTNITIHGNQFSSVEDIAIGISEIDILAGKYYLT